MFAIIHASHLTTAEAQSHFDFISFFDKAKSILQLDVKIVLFNVRAKFDFLDADDFLLLLSLFLPFLLFLSILTKIHDTADRRFCLRSDLDEIKMLLLRHAKRLTRRHDAELLTSCAGHAYFADMNFFIEAQSHL